MRKFLAGILCIILAISLLGCGKTSVIDDNNDQIVAVKNETLKLMYLPHIETGATDPNIISTDFPYESLYEMPEKRYNGDAELKVFANCIEEEWGITVDENWRVFIHFYDVEQTFGIIEFQYYIGEIATDKNIIFNLNNGKVDMIFYNQLDSVVDEEMLKSRLDLFKKSISKRSMSSQMEKQFRESR